MIEEYCIIHSTTFAPDLDTLKIIMGKKVPKRFI